MKLQKPFFRHTCTAILVLAVLIIGCNQNNLAASENASADIAVDVNGVILTVKAVDADLQSKLEPMKKQIPEDRMDKIKEQMRTRIIEDFITRTILGQESAKQKISVSEKETNDAIDEIKKGLPKGLTLESALKANNLTMEKMRADIAFGLKANKLFDSQVKYDAAISDDEVNQYYTTNKQRFDEPEKVHARHILVKTASGDNETVKAEKKAKADGLHKKLLSGSDFAEIAKENSDCPSSKKGGDLGTFTRGRMVKAFEDAAFTQKANDIGPVVETKFGYHIIQVLEHMQPVSKSLEDVKGTIEQKLSQQKKQKAIQEYIAGLRDKATITYGKQ